MRTKEINKYQVRVPKVKSQIDTPPDEIKLHTIAISCGKRNSGKSLSVFSRLRDLKDQGLADRVYLISPTKYSNYHLAEHLVADEDMYEDISIASLNSILDKIEQDAQEYEDYLHTRELYKLWKRMEKKNIEIDDIDPELLLELDNFNVIGMEEPPTWKYPKAKNGIGVFHIIFDDAQAGGLFQTKPFINMALRHRHISSRSYFKVGVSLWLLVQNYIAAGGIPRSLRENCCILCLFPVKQLDMIESIAQEMGGEVKKDEFLQAYKFATKDSDHDFLMVDFNAKSPAKRFRKNWSTYIIFDGDK